MARVTRELCTPGTEEYEGVSELFKVKHTTRKSRLVIKTIERVNNSNLEEKFEIEKTKYLNKFGRYDIVQLFHGTKCSNIPSILKDNLDVSRHGSNIGHRFGAGVSFTAHASYASNYGDKESVEGTMLLCNVLVSNIIEVPENKNNLAVLYVPPVIPGTSVRYDTTAKSKHTMDVIVKFENNTFYPTHVITFKRKSHGDFEIDGALMLELLKSFTMNE